MNLKKDELMQARTRKFSKMSVAKVSKIRNAEYQISTIYDYDKDKTEIEMEEKIDKLPRIYQLNFFKGYIRNDK